MIFSRTANHALEAATFLARQPRDRFCLVRDIARITGTPRHYLGKLLHRLAQAGVIESRRGAGGGVRLARSAKQITLFAVVQGLEKAKRTGRWLVAQRQCTESNPCPLHRGWRSLTSAYLSFLKNTSLADAARCANGRRARGSGP